MAARHFIEDEVKLCPWTHEPEPTRETLGECSCCNGTGEIPDFEKPNRLDHCYWCGGDGKSILTTHGAFHRTKPIVNCEMGRLCVKDTVRLKKKYSSDKDGIPYCRGKGTVVSFDHKHAKVYFFTIKNTKQVPLDQIIKTGR